MTLRCSHKIIIAKKMAVPSDDAWRPSSEAAPSGRNAPSRRPDPEARSRRRTLGELLQEGEAAANEIDNLRMQVTQKRVAPMPPNSASLTDTKLPPI